MLSPGAISLFQTFRGSIINYAVHRTLLFQPKLSKSLAGITVLPSIRSPNQVRKIFSLISQKKRDEISARIASDSIVWSRIYYDPRIVLFQMFSRFKLYQTFFVSALVLYGSCIIINKKQQTHSDEFPEASSSNKETNKKRKKRTAVKKGTQTNTPDPLPSIVAGVAFCSLSLSLLFAFNYFFRRIVGVLYIFYIVNLMSVYSILR